MTIARRAFFLGLDTLEKRVQYLESENASLKTVSHELVQKNLYATHSCFGKKLDGLSAASPTRLFKAFLRIDQGLVFWFL